MSVKAKVNHTFLNTYCWTCFNSHLDQLCYVHVELIIATWHVLLSQIWTKRRVISSRQGNIWPPLRANSKQLRVALSGGNQVFAFARIVGYVLRSLRWAFLSVALLRLPQVLTRVKDKQQPLRFFFDNLCRHCFLCII